MGQRNSSFTPEFREMVVLEIIDRSRSIKDVAEEVKVSEQTIRNWVGKYRKAHAEAEPELTLPERARLTELEREVRNLRMENEFLGKCAAFFAKKHR